jgi:hypothetical protein
MTNLSFSGDNLRGQSNILSWDVLLDRDVGNIDLLYYIEINLLYMHFVHIIMLTFHMHLSM